MQKLLRFVLIIGLVGATGLFTPYSVQAQTVTTNGGCLNGTQPSGALWLICIPPAVTWNHDLVVYAHGYVAPNQPLALQNLSLGDGTYLPTLIQGLGYAFATTSYRQNGLSILQGSQDILNLVEQFSAVCRCRPGHTYLAGVSEGGLITTLLMERSPQVFSGGLAACGPIGSFQKQVNYFGDFRTLFDYFFPHVIPGNAVYIPPEVMNDWGSTYVPLITNEVTTHPDAVKQLINSSHAAWDLFHPESVVATTQDLLWYSAFATDDAEAKLGGQPFDNHNRWYWGSANDFRLNVGVERYRADPTALANLQAYETTGHLTKPLVTIHTVGDDVIPFWQEVVYNDKVRAAGDTSHLIQIPILSYGHCNFTSAEILLSFAVLVQQVTGAMPSGVQQHISPSQAQQAFDRARQAVGTIPR